MARKGFQQRNGLKRGASNKYSDSEVGDKSLSYRRDKNEWEEGKLSDGNEVQSEIHGSSDDHKKDGTDITELLSNSKRNNGRAVKNSIRQRSNKHRMPNLEPLEPLVSQISGTLENDILSDDTTTRGDNEVPVGSSKCSSNWSGGNTKETLSTHNATDDAESSNTKSTCSLTILTVYALEMAKGWLAKQKPRLSNLATVICEFCGLTRIKIEQSYPIIWSWILHIGRMIFLLSLVWLDCSLRGLDSLLRLGTSSFFTVFWCGTLSVVAMIGILKMSLIVVITGFVFIFIGLAFAILVISVFATIIVWVYGSFWTTGLVIFVGGVSFVFNHERIALFIATVYAVYSAKSYVGWLGLLLGFNLSFISGDVLIYILKNKIDDQRSSRPEQAWQSQSTADHTNEDPCHDPSMGDSFASASVRPTDRGPGMPSTSGVESELTSEEEIIRLLNCGDHYSALGLARYEMIDASHLKREYRRKAMLVHPDKNMGNEKAAEAFKKLQNAYEVLLDSMKRQAYNDDLRREELLNYLRRLQTTSHKNRKHRLFNASSTHPGGEDENFHGDSRRIACKKCGDFHVWAQTDKSKSRARWCQECKDFHLAKDGDGWVEQSFQPLLFGLLQKMEPPIAYVCADSKIYEVTEWFICQGMRCPANTHKPSFHVNTSIASRGNTTKGTSSTSRGGSGGVPTANTDDTMPEEFFEWLQKSGIFDGGSPSSDSPVAKNSSSSKSNPKKKKKGKKQW